MKPLWQILHEQKAPPPKGGAKEDIWNDENKETLKMAVHAGKSYKEIIRDHFPHFSRDQVKRGIQKHKDYIGLDKVPRFFSQDAKEFHSYWNADRKYILKRAVNAGKSMPDIHLDHFSDIPQHKVKHAIETFRDELKLRRRPSGNNKAKEFYITSLDDDARQRIVSDLGKTGANVEAIARKHYTSPERVERLRMRHYPRKSMEVASAAIPQEHIDFVKDIRTGKVPIGRSQGKADMRYVGSIRIARELNKKFPEAKYTPNLIQAHIRNGTFGIEGEDRRWKPKTDMAEKHKKIWDMHQQGHPVDVIAKTHNMRPYKVRNIIDYISRGQKRVTPPVTERVSMCFKNISLAESLTIQNWKDKVAHHERKAAFHKRLADKTPEGPFKKMHEELWNHHEHEMNRAQFQLRKQQILSGEE